MPQVTHVKHARRDYPKYGIKKGDSYYWWQFRFDSVLHMQLTPPTRGQLTQSSFLQELYEIEDGLGALSADKSLADEVPSFVDRINDLRSTCEDSLSNMPEQLQESSNAGQLLQERIDGLESWAGDLEGFDLEVDEDQIREDVKNEYEEWDENAARDEIIHELEQQTLEEDAEFDADEHKEEIGTELEKRHEAWQEELDNEAQTRIESAWEDILNDIQGCESGL